MPNATATVTANYASVTSVTYPYPNATEYYPTIAQQWSSDFSSLNYTWEPYLSLGDVSSLLGAGDFLTYNPFGIFEQSCWDGDIQNCTSVCSDPSLLFANTSTKRGPEMNTQVPYNLLTCQFYPVLSKLLGSAHPDNSSWDQLQAISQQYNIIPNASDELVQSMVDAQVNCYTYFCLWQDSNFCVNYDMNTGDYQAIVAPGVFPLFPDWSTITPADTFSINSDIGGIGVSIAYAIEAALILFIWVALRLPRFIKWVRHKRLASNRGAKEAIETTTNQKRQQELIHAVAHHSDKLHERVTELLTDFHQAQCWFFIPLNLTVLLGLGGETVIFQITSMGQLSANMAYVACVCQGGIVFAVATMYFVLFEAHHVEENYEEEHKDDEEKPHRLTQGDRHGINDPKKMIVFWVLTFVAVTLGTVGWLWSFRIHHPAKLIAATVGTPQLAWIDYCGLVAPSSYNGATWDPYALTHKPNIHKRLAIIIFCWIMILGMFVFFFRASITRILKKARFLEKPVRVLYGAPAQTWIKRVVILLLEVFVLCCIAFFLEDYISFMRPSLPQISKDFTMGQLLALFVWAPVFVNSFYLMWDWLAAMTRTLIANRSTADDTTEYIQMSTKTNVPAPSKFQREDSGFH